MRKTLLALAMGLITTTAFAGAGHGGSQAAVSDADIDRTIRLEAGDMWFNAENLDIAPGDTINFKIVNTGNLEHEFVIGDAKAQQEHREMMQAMRGSGHGNGGNGGHGMAGGEQGASMPSVTIAPGDTAELVWTAPQNVDGLEYACNIPGHYEAGMSGHIDFQG
ncbi:MAG: plastocyanin/azurin family copper-binding protein [Halomonas sp.]|uniref:cupredoxin domain-containing protein n=1 Tax=Halomonas sp. TaxID=1486246 RepID=UPI0028703BF6|nr:plastocyanin/azurin family copper-binding protein [Halomonas sp.]MDR9438717.1 plastocyanin/azurin family copper-binding protein [Halomonas sp.]